MHKLVDGAKETFWIFSHGKPEKLITLAQIYG